MHIRPVLLIFSFLLVGSVAVQALSSIRTVRAFSTEPLEVAKYSAAMTQALQKGLKDAFTSAMTFALTNYLGSHAPSTHTHT